MRIDVLTLFPGMFRGPLDESIVKRATDAGIVDIHLHDIRDWAEGRHRVCLSRGRSASLLRRGHNETDAGDAMGHRGEPPTPIRGEEWGGQRGSLY
jgi:hypothetical protein